MADGKPTLCFIGFGEAGQAIASGLRETGVERIVAWDILFPHADGERLKRSADAIGVRCASSAAEAARGADIIVSAVTAAASIDAAQSVTAHMTGKPFFLDINSVSPGRKQETAKLLGGGARYVDVAVVAAIYPARHQTPLLLAGADAELMSRKNGFPARCALTDCAASTLAAAVTADTMMSASRTASAAEDAQRTPIASALRLSLSPSVCGNRMSQAAMRSTPLSRRPEAIAWPASPKPMKQNVGFPFGIIIP